MTEDREFEKTLWLAADKLHSRSNNVLFIDARDMGTRISGCEVGIDE